jgi:hypothetical protein
MTCRASVASLTAMIAAALFLLDGGAALGLVFHPGDEPLPDFSLPGNALIGRWGFSASFVVIGPNHIITTRHQVVWPTSVVIDGVSYLTVPVAGGTGGPKARGDVQVVRITRSDGTDANLEDFARLFTGDSELGQEVIIGGYGKVRGLELADPLDYGYEWTTGEHRLMWGRNVIDDIQVRPMGPYFTRVVEADFDAINRGGYVAHEAGVAEWDSGGGWFLADETFRLVGLSAYTQRGNETWFDDPATSSRYDPDWMAAIRVKDFVPWIQDILGYEPVGGDTDRDGDVDLTDYVQARNSFSKQIAIGSEWQANWQDGDFDCDDDVDYLDYLAMKKSYGHEFVPQPTNVATPAVESAVESPGGYAAPEPATLGLLILGAGALLARRPRRRP